MEDLSWRQYSQCDLVLANTYHILQSRMQRSVRESYWTIKNNVWFTKGAFGRKKINKREIQWINTGKRKVEWIEITEKWSENCLRYKINKQEILQCSTTSIYRFFLRKNKRVCRSTNPFCLYLLPNILHFPSLFNFNSSLCLPHLIPTKHTNGIHNE